MSYYYVNTAFEADSLGTYHGGVVTSAADDLATYLTNQIDNATFGFADYGKTSVRCIDHDTEIGFVKAAMQEMKDTGFLVAGDSVVIAHECIDYGYGGGKYTITLSDGSTATGAAVFAGTLVPGWEVQAFTWHELCHAYGPWHDDPDVDVDTNELMHSITPMGAGYVHDESGDSDTLYSAVDGDPSDPTCPDSFCYGESNFHYPGFKYSSNKDNHDLNRLSFCTLDLIQDWVNSR
ncbi:hypothetical protein ACFQH6_20590 [Halobacteriaceae archaeon GCM10025711]